MTRHERDALTGQGMVEYGLIMAFISVAAIAVVTILGPTVSELFQTALDALLSIG